MGSCVAVGEHRNSFWSVWDQGRRNLHTLRGIVQWYISDPWDKELTKIYLNIPLKKEKKKITTTKCSDLKSTSTTKIVDTDTLNIWWRCLKLNVNITWITASIF